VEKRYLKNEAIDDFDSENTQLKKREIRNVTNVGHPTFQMALLKRFSPVRFLFILIVSIFLAEVVAMIVVLTLEPMPYSYLTLLDATIMVVLIFPAVYFLSFRPLIAHIEKRRQAEEALLYSMELQDRFFDSINTLIAYMDRDFNFIRVNEAYAKADGHPTDFFVGKNHFELYPHVENQSIFQQVVDSGKGFSVKEKPFEYPDQPGRGITYWNWSLLPVMGANRRVEGVVLSLVDVTERKQAEQALQERTKELAVTNEELISEINERKDVERQLRIQTTAMDAAANGIMITDPHGEIMWVNPALTKMTGYLKEELVGKKTRIFKSDQHDSDYYRNMWATILLGHVWQGETVNRRKDGSTYIEEQTITPVLDEHSQIAYFIAVKQDVTVQKKVEAALEVERTRLKNILDTMPDGVYIINQNYDVEYINPVIEREFGAVGGHKCYTYFHGLEEPCSWCRNDEVFAGTPFVGERTYAKNNKSYEVFDAPLVNSDGSISKLKLLHDITQRKKMEQELEQSNLNLQVASNAERNQRQFAEALVAAALILNKSQKLDEVLTIILEQIKEVIPYQFASIGLLDGESFFEASHRGNTDLLVDQVDTPNRYLLDDFPLLKTMCQSSLPILVSNTQLEKDWIVVERFEWCRSFLSAPLIIEKKMIGFVNLFARQVDFFTQEMCDRLVAFAAHAAAAIQNAWLFEQVQTSSEHMQSLSRRLVEVQEAERLFISRELHDEAAQKLTSLMIDLRVLEKNSSQPEVILKKVTEMDSSLKGISESLHNVAMTLRPASLDHLGLVPALRQHVESVGDKYGLKTRFKTRDLLKRLPLNTETILYRIVQETLTNVVRHAHATQVDVVLTVRDGKLIVLIEDDGIGFNPEEVPVDGHLGLLGIRERVEMIDGNLMIESVPGEGTTIIVEVSYDDSIVDRG